LQGNGVDQINLARDERGQTCGIVADGLEHHLAHVALDCAPVRRVAREHGPHARLALAQAVRAGAVGFERGGVLAAFAPVGRAFGSVVGSPDAAEHVHRSDEVGQDRVGRAGLQLNGVVVDLAHLFDRGHLRAHVRAFAAGTLNGKHYIVSRERRAIVKAHTASQLEAPDIGLSEAPARGQRRYQLQ
jgi:hypothetical protein